MHEKYTFLTLCTDRGDAIMIKKGVIFMTEEQKKASQALIETIWEDER